MFDCHGATPQTAMKHLFVTAVAAALLLADMGSGAGPCAAADARSWTLTTADTVATVGVSHHQPVMIRLEDAKTHQNWLDRPTAVPLLDRVWLGGRERATQWGFQRAVQSRREGTLRLVFTNGLPALALQSVWRARPGRGPVEHWVEIENRSQESVAVSHQDSLVLGRLATGPEATLCWIRRGGASATTQGGTFLQPLTNGTDLVLTNNCDWGAGDSPVPWLAVQLGGARGLFVGWEFSGLGRVQAKGEDGACGISVGLWPGFKTDIEPGETLLIPKAFVGCHAGDLEDGSYSLHRFIIEKLRPTLPQSVPDPILTYNLYLDYGMTNATESDVLRSAKFCRDLGFEAFMPDAMWYPECGDWRWDPKRFPRGMKPIRDFVRANGMRQALWCAWSNGGVSEDPGALSVRGTNGHPDWFSTNTPPDWAPGPHYGAKLCFGSPEASAWAMRKTQRLVQEFQLDYLKHDSDPIVNLCLQTNHRHHYGVDASYWATLGYYQVQEALHKQFPQLIIEDCSGGGHIKDFGIIQRTHLIATTDMLSNLADRQSIYDSTYAFPPLVLQCYTYDNNFPVPGDRPGVFLWRSAMMGAWHIDPTDTAGWSEEETESARQSTRIYKEWIRPMLKDVKVHHVLPRADGTNWDGMFFWSAPLMRGTLFVFRPDSPEPQRTVKLKGLSPDTQYWVWSENGSVKSGVSLGRELMSEGVGVRLENRFNCDLVHVREAKQGRPVALDPPGRFKLRSALVAADYFTNRVTLRWTESLHARDYRVIVSDDPRFTRVVLDRRTSRTELELRLSPDRRFYWKVEAHSIGGTRAPGGNSGSFATVALKPLPKGVVFASDLPWIKACAGDNNSVRRDANIRGQTIRLGCEYYPKGLWTHAFNDSTPADVVFDLGALNPFAMFAADVALEDSAGRGSVQFQVLVDNVVKAQSPIMRLGAVYPLRVPLAGARQLTLRVLNGGDGNSCDHAAWGAARFLKAGTENPFRQ